jgi:hypothetical protein
MRSGSTELWTQKGERLWAVDSSSSNDREKIFFMPDLDVIFDPRGTDFVARDFQTGAEKWKIRGAAGEYSAKFVAHVENSRVLITAGAHLLKVWDLGLATPTCVRSFQLYMPSVGCSRYCRNILGLHALSDRKHFIAALSHGAPLEVFSLPVNLWGK